MLESRAARSTPAAWTMNGRLLAFGLVALAALCLAVLFYAPPGGAPQPPAPGEAAAAPGEPVAAGALTDSLAAPAGGGPARETVAVAEPPEIGSSRVSALPGGRQEVIVRVRLLTPAGAPYSFAGHQVDAQSWIEDTNETFPHAAPADGRGVAEFVFPGFVHIDWLRYLPPPESGLALAYSEHHIDLEPGSLFEAELRIGPGAAALHGRVVDEYGAPVAGARVHAYGDGDLWSDLTEFTPGILWAATSSDGGFLLSSLPPGIWGLAVEPGGWLQLDPVLGDYSAGRAIFELEERQLADAGRFTVTALHSLAVTVEDSSGAPVANAGVSLEPLAFRSPAVSLEEPEEPMDESVQQWLDAPGAERGAAAIPWPYGTLSWSTKEDGRAAVFGPAGRWLLSVSANFDREREFAAQREIDLPGAPVQLVLPFAPVTLSGRVVGGAGQPVAGASVTLQQAGARDWGLLHAATNQDGGFRFDRLPPRGSFTVHVSHDDFVPARCSADLSGALEPLLITLQAGRTLRLRAVDPSGQALANLNFTLPDAEGAPAEVPYLYVNVLSRMRWQRPRGRSRTSDAQGQVEFGGLAPGSYEVKLLLPFVADSAPPGGWPQTEDRAYRSWTLATQEEPHVLVIDLSGYAPPQPPAMATHQGVVRSAASGEAVAEALVTVYGTETANSAYSQEDGGFWLEIPAHLSARLEVLAIGYLPWSAGADNHAGSHHHEVALQPDAGEIELLLQDRGGRPLPNGELLFEDESGAPAPYRSWSDGAYGDWSESATFAGGKLLVRGLAPGSYRLRLLVSGVELGTASLLWSAAGARRTVPVYFERSLEEMREVLAATISQDQ